MLYNSPLGGHRSHKPSPSSWAHLVSQAHSYLLRIIAVHYLVIIDTLIVIRIYIYIYISVLLERYNTCVVVSYVVLFLECHNQA